MSGPNLFVFAAGLGLGFGLGFAVGILAPQMPDPTPEQMMQMMSIYCGEDGCQ